jgi:hypothetical protein
VTPSPLRSLDAEVAETDDDLTRLLSDLWVAARVGTIDECNDARAAIVKYVDAARRAALEAR